jgi:hypothetical protein
MLEEDAQVGIGDDSWLPAVDDVPQFRQYLEAHGYDTSAMGLRDSSSVSVVDEKASTEKVAV